MEGNALEEKFNFKYSEKHLKLSKPFSSPGKSLSCPYVYIVGKIGMRGVFFCFCFQNEQFCSSVLLATILSWLILHVFNDRVLCARHNPELVGDGLDKAGST